MRAHQRNPQSLCGDQHNGCFGRCQIGEKLGVAGEIDASIIDYTFLQRRRNESRKFAGLTAADRTLDSVEQRPRIARDPAFHKPQDFASGCGNTCKLPFRDDPASYLQSVTLEIEHVSALCKHIGIGDDHDLLRPRRRSERKT